MIFNLPPILGLLPLVLYLVMNLRGYDIRVATVLSLTLSAILTKQSLLTMGSLLQSALGQFLTLVGFIIMLGSGLGEILKKTGVAQNLVHISLNRFNISTVKRSLALTGILSMTLTALLGTLAGANAAISPILLPIVASIGVVPGSVGIMMLAGGVSGMILGPFTPTSVTIRELSGLGYGEFMLHCAVPLSLIIMLGSYYMALRLQKQGGDGEVYDTEALQSADTAVSATASTRSTVVFLLTIGLMIAYGIYSKAGASYAIMIMSITSIFVALSSKMKSKEIVTTFMAGASKMVHMFILFVLFVPFLNLISATGAYDALVGYATPLIDAGGVPGFMLVASSVGIWGISGAAVAQAQVINDIFSPMVAAMNLPNLLWGMVIMYGCVLTSLALPGGDMMGSFGLAQSKNIKAALKTNYFVIALALVYLLVRAFLYTAIG